MRHTEKTVKIMYVSFHVTRGGRFYNPGHLEFVGEMDFQELQSYLDSHIFIKNRDEKGRFCKPYIADCDGNQVSYDDISAMVGTIDLDGDYDTYYVMDADDMGEEELEAIRKYKGYLPDELRAMLTDYGQ